MAKRATKAMLKGELRIAKLKLEAAWKYEQLQRAQLSDTKILLGRTQTDLHIALIELENVKSQLETVRASAKTTLEIERELRLKEEGASAALRGLLEGVLKIEN